MDITELKALAKQCRVSMNAACRKADMATSTPFRWGRGTIPTDGQVDRLRRAILQVAVNQGTLPPEMQAELPPEIVRESDDPKQLARHLRHLADRVEALVP